MSLDLSSKSKEYIVSSNSTSPIICEKIELLSTDNTGFIRFTNCKIQHKVSATIKPEKILCWNTSPNLFAEMQDNIQIYSQECNLCSSNYALEVLEYILRNEDFKKARTYNKELAEDLGLDWSFRIEESAIKDANNKQELLNKKTRLDNTEFIIKLIQQIRIIFFMGKKHYNSTNIEKEKALKKNENVHIPSTITKKLIDDIIKEFPYLEFKGL